MQLLTYSDEVDMKKITIKHIISNGNVILYLLEKTLKGNCSRTFQINIFLEPSDSEAKAKIDFRTQIKVIFYKN